MKAMILAAGLGTRLRPVTEKFAKPAVSFLNVPLLYYPISLLEEAGLDRLVINTHHKPEQVETLALTIPGYQGEVTISHEPGAPLGSGGGIWKARQYLEGSGSFLISNGDEVILPHRPDVMKEFVASHEASDALATILVMRHPLVGTQFGGVWADAAGRVHGFGKDASKFPGCIGYHYIGIQILSDRVFKYLPEGESNILYDALASGIACGETVRVIVEEFTWFETGNPRDFLEATHASLELLTHNPSGSLYQRDFLERVCRRFWIDGNERPSLLRGTADHVADDALEAGSLALFGKSVLVEHGALLKGFVVLGDHVTVHAGATVENSVVLSNSTVQSTQTVQGEIRLP